MRFIYISATVIIFVWLGQCTLELADSAPTRVMMVMRITGVPNSVTGILFHFRIYDTIFEVFVFTVAVLGVQHYLPRQPEAMTIYHASHDTIVILARIGAMVAGLVALELAIRGHLAPGGGFAAGVAGGTCIGLIAVTSEHWRSRERHEKWHASLWEKCSVLLFLGLSVPILAGVEFPRGYYGTLLSGGATPLLNFLIAFKVAIGSWTILYMFIRFRGLL